MKILFVMAHIGKGGGQAIQSLNIIREISKEHETRILTLKYPGMKITPPCPVTYAGVLRFPSGIYRLYKIAKKIAPRYDVIQCFDAIYSHPAVWLAGSRNHCLRLGLTLDDFFKERNIPFPRFFSSILMLPFRAGRQKLVTNSRHLQRKMRKYRPRYVPNGYDIQRFSKKRSKSSIKKKFGLPKDRILLLFTGKVIPRKNIGMILRSLVYMPDCHLIVAGETSEQYYGNSYFKALKASYRSVMDRVTFTGELPYHQVAELLSACDVFVFPSRNEGSPNSVIEAMAAGLPVACLDTESHREIVQDKKTGLLFSSEKELVESVNVLVKDKRIRRDMIMNAHRYVKDNHDIKDTAQAYLEIYKEAARWR